MFYFYADGSACRCVYVGNEEAYQRFRQMIKERQLNEDILTTSDQAQDEFENTILILMTLLILKTVYNREYGLENETLQWE